MQSVHQFLTLGRAALRPDRQKTEKAEAEEKLNKVVGASHEMIFSATTVFPLTFFPDTVSIDRTKLNVTKRTFFWAAEVISIKMEDILNVTATVGPFFGSIQIHTRFFDPHKPYSVNLLRRKDALKIDRIMRGYSIALDKNIDLSVLDTKKLAKSLDKLGQAAPSAQL